MFQQKESCGGHRGTNFGELIARCLVEIVQLSGHRTDGEVRRGKFGMAKTKTLVQTRWIKF